MSAPALPSDVLLSFAREGRAWASDILAWSEQVAVVLFPQGGQGQARRNAWQAMAWDAVGAAARRESEAALRQAVERAALDTRPASAIGAD